MNAGQYTLRTEGEFAALVVAKTNPIPDENGCLLWTGTPSRYGYARMMRKKKEILIHRYVLEKKLGRRLRSGEIAMHSCDIRLCINPDHLSPGTTKQNQRDKGLRNRAAKGEGHGMSKLTNDAVLRITFGGEDAKVLANEYGVSKTNIHYIRRGEIWGHITGKAYQKKSKR